MFQSKLLDLNLSLARARCRVFDSNEPHTAAFPAPSDDLPRKAGSAIFGEGSYPDKDVEGWLRRMCILR